MILVLALLTFALVVLTRFSQESLKLAAQAKSREREIQDRWGTWSIASTMLPRAERVLRPGGVGTEERTSLATSTLNLGGQHFYVYVNDLDAAINLNTVVRESGVTGLSRAITFGSHDVAIVPRRVMQATAGGEARDGQRIVYDSWGQLFHLSGLPRGSGNENKIASLQESITCWGSGRLNLGRATDETIRQFGRAVGRNGLFGRVVRERKATPRRGLQGIIARAANAPGDAQLLRRTLRPDSVAWSVLVVPEAGGPSLMLVLESGFGTFADRRSTFSF